MASFGIETFLIAELVLSLKKTALPSNSTSKPTPVVPSKTTKCWSQGRAQGCCFSFALGESCTMLIPLHPDLKQGCHGQPDSVLSQGKETTNLTLIKCPEERRGRAAKSVKLHPSCACLPKHIYTWDDQMIAWAGSCSSQVRPRVLPLLSTRAGMCTT